MEELLQDELFAVISDDALCAANSRRSRIVENSTSMRLVRCFKGAHNAQQEIPLMRALQEFLDKGLVKVEYLLCDQVKKERWDEQQVVAWLIASDVHLIITHVHQNIVELLGWNMTTLIYELQKLYDHPGYPYRNFLRDPIFLQDKYEYLRLVQNICNPTLKIALRENNGYNHDDISSISTFLNKHQESTKSWMMKLAFVTNGFHMQQVHTYEEILSRLKYYSGKFYGIYPYVMLQPYLYNKKEYKVAVYNGKALYICRSSKRYNERAFSNPIELMKFAEDAVAALRCETRNICFEGVIRVDIMQGNDGSSIVNEFESLEACIWSSDNCIRNESITQSYQSTFWKTQLLKFIPI